MTIKEIVPVKKRRKVVLEDESSFYLYPKEVNTYRLAEGEELTDEVWDDICENVLKLRATKYAMHLLEKLDRTEYQLRTKLKEKGYPSKVIDKAIEYVASFNYINDERYAQMYIEYHQNTKNKLQLKMILSQRGVPKDIIENSLEEYYVGNDEVLIKRYLDKKHYDPETADRKEKYKLYSYLMGKGYNRELISRCMNVDES